MTSRTLKLAAAFVLFCLSALPFAARAAAQTLGVAAVVLSKNTCQFNNPKSATLAFGNLDPLNPVDVTVNATLRFVCRGSDPIATFLISDNDGLHESGPNGNRMQHATNPAAYLPYSITLSPQTGNAPKNVNQTLTVSGTVLGSDYQTALAGNYADTVTILIQP